MGCPPTCSEMHTFDGACVRASPRPMVYVAGPITGDPFGCVRQATAAFVTLRALGCVPFLPQLSVLHEMVAPMPYEDWLAYDLDVIRRCQALVRLPGASEGADREVAFAADLGLPVFHWGEDGTLDEVGAWLGHPLRWCTFHEFEHRFDGVTDGWMCGTGSVPAELRADVRGGG